MSELTPEEKRKIYEEEKARLEAQAQIKKKMEKRKTKPATWGCLILIIFGIIWIIAVFSPSKKSESPSPPPPREEVDLNAQVLFTGTQFKITNKNNFNWTDVKLEVNGKYFYNVSIIKPNIEYTVGAMQFAKRDGTRFNPFTMKPRDFFLLLILQREELIILEDGNNTPNLALRARRSADHDRTQ